MSTKLLNVRLAFPNLFEAKAFNEGSPRYSATFIFEKGHPAEQAMRSAIEAVGAEKWGSKWPTVRNELESKDRTALHSGASKATYAGFDGNLFVSASSKPAPLVIDGRKNLLTSADGRPYGGCFVNAHIDVWAQDNQYGRRINASLRGVQLVRDGDAFAGGGSANPTDFDEVEEEALV
jgi:hypothetical protein